MEVSELIASLSTSADAAVKQVGATIATKPLLDIDEFHRQVAEQTNSAIADDLAERRKRRLEQLMGRAAIPLRFMDRTLDSYNVVSAPQHKALTLCRQYASDFNQLHGAAKTGACLVLCGQPGTGKTHLAAGIAHELLASGSTAIYLTAMQLIRQIRETWHNRMGKTESQAIADFVKPDLLILDEVGVQFGTEAEKVQLFDVINARYEAMKPMIVISNLMPEELTTFLGERAMDRLREGGGRAFGFTWGSYRRGGA